MNSIAPPLHARLDDSTTCADATPVAHPAILRYVRAFTAVHSDHGRARRFHTLHRLDLETHEPREVFVPLIDFFQERRRASTLPLQKAHADSVRLLLDHLEARGSSLSDGGATALEAFVDDLLCGTVDECGHDPSGLYWPERSVEVVEGHLSRVSAFSDWLTVRFGHRPLNPWSVATPAERVVALRRLERRTEHALLNHAAIRRGQMEHAGTVRRVRVRWRRDVGDIHAFNERDFDRLLRDGWGWRPHMRYQQKDHHRLRNHLITLLLHAGGLRLSEVFHLYAGDVVLDRHRPGEAIVLMFHPEDGQAPDEPGGPWKHRAQYLWSQFRLLPRTQEEGRFHAGWKNLALTDTKRHATRVWFVPTTWAATFWELYGEYMRLRPSTGRHPFLFVSEHGAQYGQPYTLGAFKKAHAAAVRRAGLESGKHAGTTPHGHRHAYGSRLADDNVEPRAIKRVMHHRSLASQEVYKNLSDERTAAAMDAAFAASMPVTTDRPRRAPSSSPPPSPSSRSPS